MNQIVQKAVLTMNSDGVSRKESFHLQKIEFLPQLFREQGWRKDQYSEEAQVETWIHD